jgi:phosphohistidine phosphatase
MKNLLLFRHAKSSWANASSDKLRPLENSGSIDAAIISKELIPLLPSHYSLFSSDAKRAQETAKIFIENAGIQIDTVDFNDDLYTFDSTDIERFIKKINPSIETALLFGHNPAFTEFANKYGNQLIDNLPTAGLVWIVFEENNWYDIQKGTTKMFLYPKAYK